MTVTGRKAFGGNKPARGQVLTNEMSRECLAGGAACPCFGLPGCAQTSVCTDESYILSGSASLTNSRVFAAIPTDRK